MTAYRTVKQVAPPQGQGLNDLYVRFFRMAERRITEGPEGKGIVCFISNYSWLDGLSFTGMRERYLEVFDKIWIDCLNGDKYKTGKLTPDGLPDPSVFSTEKNREGIGDGGLMLGAVRDWAGGRGQHHWGEVLRGEQTWRGGHGGGRIRASGRGGLPLLPAAALDYTTWPNAGISPSRFPGKTAAMPLWSTSTDRLIACMGRYSDLL